MGNDISTINNCDDLQKLYNYTQITPNIDPVYAKSVADKYAAMCGVTTTSSESPQPPPRNTAPVTVANPVATGPIEGFSSGSTTIDPVITPPPVVTPPPVTPAVNPFNPSSYATCDDLMTAIANFGPGPNFNADNVSKLQDEYRRRNCQPPPSVVQPPPKIDPQTNEAGTAGVYTPGTGAAGGAANPSYTPPPTIYPGPSRPPIPRRPPQPYQSPDLLLYGSIAAGAVLLVLGLSQSMRI